MLLYKDFEIIYSNIHIYEKFLEVGVLWAHRRNSEADKVAYHRGRKELKHMIESAKQLNFVYNFCVCCILHLGVQCGRIQTS